MMMSEFEGGKGPDEPPDTSAGAHGAAGMEKEEAQAPEAAVPEIALPEPAMDVPPIAGGPMGSAVFDVRAAVAPARARGSLFFARLVQAVWVGSAVFLGFSALAVFRAVGPTGGADAVGAMLTRWHYIALIAPAILILVEWWRMRSRMVMLLFVAVILAVVQGFTDLRIRRIRMSSPIPISSLDENDPLRRHFGALHGFSSLLLLAQVVGGISVIAAEPDPD
jgi:hypothetical protein